MPKEDRILRVDTAQAPVRVHGETICPELHLQHHHAARHLVLACKWILDKATVLHLQTRMEVASDLALNLCRHRSEAPIKHITAIIRQMIVQFRLHPSMGSRERPVAMSIMRWQCNLLLAQRKVTDLKVARVVGQEVVRLGR